MGMRKKTSKERIIATKVTIVSRYGAPVTKVKETVPVTPEEGETENEAFIRVSGLAEARIAELMEENPKAKEGDFYIINRGIRTTTPFLWRNIHKKVTLTTAGPKMPESERKTKKKKLFTPYW